MSGLSYPRRLVGASLKLAEGTLLVDAPWYRVDYAEVIGHGEDDFQRAADNLFSWRAHRAAHVRVDGKPSAGEVVQLHFGPTVSPCRIISVERSRHRAVLVYGTMHGHIECGEEAFIVELSKDGEVTGRCVAFSQHSWWLARVFSGPARIVQRWATKRYVRGRGRDLVNVV